MLDLLESVTSVISTDVFQKALSGGVSNLSFTTLSSDLARTMYKYSLRIPPYYTLLVRSLSVLEGIALASDPNYKVRRSHCGLENNQQQLWFFVTQSKTQCYSCGIS